MGAPAFWRRNQERLLRRGWGASAKSSDDLHGRCALTAITAWKGHSILALLVRLYLGGLFLVACIHKIRHPELFAVDVATYQLLPLSTVNLFSIVIPWIELAVGAMLLLGVRT